MKLGKASDPENIDLKQKASEWCGTDLHIP